MYPAPSLGERNSRCHTKGILPSIDETVWKKKSVRQLLELFSPDIFTIQPFSPQCSHCILSMMNPHSSLFSTSTDSFRRSLNFESIRSASSRNTLYSLRLILCLFRAVALVVLGRTSTTSGNFLNTGSLFLLSDDYCEGRWKLGILHMVGQRQPVLHRTRQQRRWRRVQ